MACCGDMEQLYVTVTNGGGCADRSMYKCNFIRLRTNNRLIKLRVGFTFLSRVFAGLDVLIQTMFVTILLLSNYIFWWSIVILSIPDAIPGDFQWCFCRVSNSWRFFYPKTETITTGLRQQLSQKSPLRCNCMVS